jgi:ABC-type Mn2+/Zn2+ transport system ATPase subunit
MIARALMMDPDVLLLDEPTAGIDVHMQEQFYDLIKHFNTVHGLTTIMITHDAERQYTFGDHVICLTKTLSKEQENTLRDQFKQKTISLIQLP